MVSSSLKRGFTLIELLIVIAVIAVLAAVAFVALDPLTRFQDARDAARVTDATAILSAIKIDQVDNGGSYLASINAAANDTVYLLVGGAKDDQCNAQNANCDTDIAALDSCIDISGLVDEGYLAEVPVSPAGAVTWDLGAADADNGTGYTLEKSASGAITIRACESENPAAAEIAVTR